MNTFLTNKQINQFNMRYDFSRMFENMYVRYNFGYSNKYIHTDDTDTGVSRFRNQLTRCRRFPFPESINKIQTHQYDVICLSCNDPVVKVITNQTL